LSAGKIVLLVFGVIILLISIGLLFVGGSLMWVDKAHIDSEGFINSNTIQVERDSRAVVTGPIDIDATALRVLEGIGLVTDFEVEGRSNDSSKGIFIGVAEETDLKAYLSNVAYDEMTSTDFGWRLSIDEVTYIRHPGSSTPAPPTSQTFWTESAHGVGTQTMEWETEVGRHSIVLMNDDGSAGVDLSVIYKVKVPSIFGLSLGLVIGGVVVLVIGGLMVYFAVRRSKITTGSPS
jgi:hypothetical protein